MPVNWARCLEWSSSFSHSYANRTLLYTQAQCVFQTSHAETRNAAPNARKYYDIGPRTIEIGSFLRQQVYDIGSKWQVRTPDSNAKGSKGELR